MGKKIQSTRPESANKASPTQRAMSHQQLRAGSWPRELIFRSRPLLQWISHRDRDKEDPPSGTPAVLMKASSNGSDSKKTKPSTKRGRLGKEASGWQRKLCKGAKSPRHPRQSRYTRVCACVRVSAAAAFPPPRSPGCPLV